MNRSRYSQMLHRIKFGSAAEVSLDFCQLVLASKRRKRRCGRVAGLPDETDGRAAP